MPPNPKQVLDYSLNREESLRLTGRFELAHLSLSLAGWLVGDFGPVVGVTFRDVDDRRHGCPLCRSIAPQLVGHEPPRFASLAKSASHCLNLTVPRGIESAKRTKAPPDDSARALSPTGRFDLVAGAGFEPATFGL